MIKLVDFKPEHLNHFNLKDLDVNIQPMRELAVIFKSGPAYTLFKDGEIVTIGGVAKLWKGVGEAWALVSQPVKHPVLFHKTIKTMLDFIIKNERLHRVQAVVFVNNIAGHRWIESLGFQGEGILKKYGPDKQDAVRYARVL